MYTGRALLLAVLSIAISAAVPASASAVEWLHNGEPIKEGADDTMHYHGRKVAFGSSYGSVVCEYHPTLTITGPSEAEMTAVNITTSTCTGTGVYEGCKMTADIPTDLPWEVDITNNKTFDITDFTLDATYECSGSTVAATYSFPTVTATVDVPEAITEVELSGKGTSTFGLLKSEATLESILEVAEEDAGKFGLG